MNPATSSPSLAEAARGYAKSGFPVFPCVARGKVPLPGSHGYLDATTDLEQIATWWKVYPNANIGMPTGIVVVLDVDGPKGEATLKQIEAPFGPLPSTREVASGRGRHLYFRWHGAPISNSSGKLGPHLDVRGLGGYVMLPPSVHENGKTYRLLNDHPITLMPEWLANLLLDPPAPLPKPNAQGKVSEGGRNDYLFRQAGSMRRRNMTIEAIEQALLEENRVRCHPPLPEYEVRQIVKSILNYPPGINPAASRERPAVDVGQENSPSPPPSPAAPEPAVTWPDPLAPEAFYGLMGDAVHAIEPHSEADPVALLLQGLAFAGNIIGSRPHYRVDGAAHRVNLYVVLVGQTSKGRKGTAQSRVAETFQDTDREWLAARVLGGLASGEGLIWACRDQILRRVPTRKNGHITGYEEEESDRGVTDKRLLVVESEFSRVLKLAAREGSILSEIMRQGWDSGNLRTMSKNSPAVATGAHISIIGHVTSDELLRCLCETEQANGFANRVLWTCVRRSKYLPDDEAHCIDLATLDNLRDQMRAAVRFAQGVDEMRKDENTRAAWRAVYKELTQGKPGLLGSMTSRAEAQVLRLSMISALLDQSGVIQLPHLKAALAVWDYCERSARHIFGDALGDPTADTILAALRNSPGGLTRTDISAFFSRNKPASEVARALGVLLSLGLAAVTKEDGPHGRTVDRWTTA